jgi:hypothetical protein
MDTTSNYSENSNFFCLVGFSADTCNMFGTHACVTALLKRKLLHLRALRAPFSNSSIWVSNGFVTPHQFKTKNSTRALKF